MKKSIDLGVSPKEAYGAIPSSPMDEDRTIYPCFHYSGDESLDLPRRGKMLIEFSVREETTRTDEDGDTRYMCDIQVEKILSVEGEKDIRPSKRDMSAEDALDAIAKALNTEKSDDNDEGY